MRWLAVKRRRLPSWLLVSSAFATQSGSGTCCDQRRLEWSRAGRSADPLQPGGVGAGLGLGSAGDQGDPAVGRSVGGGAGLDPGLGEQSLPQLDGGVARVGAGATAGTGGAQADDRSLTRARPAAARARRPSGRTTRSARGSSSLAASTVSASARPAGGQDQQRQRTGRFRPAGRRGGGPDWRPAACRAPARRGRATRRAAGSRRARLCRAAKPPASGRRRLAPVPGGGAAVPVSTAYPSAMVCRSSISAGSTAKLMASVSAAASSRLSRPLGATSAARWSSDSTPWRTSEGREPKVTRAVVFTRLGGLGADDRGRKRGPGRWRGLRCSASTWTPIR